MVKTINLKNNIAEVIEYLKALYPYKNIAYGIQFKINCGVINIYFSGKLVYQGSEECKNIIEEILDKFVDLSVDLPSIGCDEAGKGEYLGPVVVSCVWVATQDCYKRLQLAGFTDSKELNKHQIFALYDWLKATVREQSNIKVSYMIIEPQKFDHIYSHMGNLSRVLDYMYIHTILKLPLADNIVIDAYSKKVLVSNFIPSVTVRQRAEELFHVAAASVIAKVLYEKWIEDNVPGDIATILRRSDLSIVNRKTLLSGIRIDRWVKNVFSQKKSDNS